MAVNPPGYARDYRRRYLADRPTAKRLRQFFARVVKDAETGCWNWSGKRTGGRLNYAYLAYGTAHAVSHAWFIGPIPVGFQVDHLCLNTLCVNPAHLEAVTHTENHRRFEATRTHCSNGHQRSSYWRPPVRGQYGFCLLCSRASAKKHYWKKKREAA